LDSNDYTCIEKWAESADVMLYVTILEKAGSSSGTHCEIQLPGIKLAGGRRATATGHPWRRLVVHFESSQKIGHKSRGVRHVQASIPSPI